MEVHNECFYKKENQEKEYLDAKVKYEKQLLIVNSLREKIKIKQYYYYILYLVQTFIVKKKKK